MSEAERWSAIIADDEAALRDALRRRLAQVWPELAVVAEPHNGLAALAAIGDHEPEVAFLDIRMPGLDGIEVARRVAGRCHVVFVTAYDEYAVAAFEAEAVDYLLKPVTEERLALTVARLRTRLAERAAPRRLGERWAQMSGQLGQASRKPLRWIRASLGETTQVIDAAEVRCFVAADKYTSVVTRDAELLIRKPIKELDGVGSRLFLADSSQRDRQSRLRGAVAARRGGTARVGSQGRRHVGGEPRLRPAISSDVAGAHRPRRRRAKHRVAADCDRLEGSRCGAKPWPRSCWLTTTKIT